MTTLSPPDIPASALSSQATGRARAHRPGRHRPAEGHQPGAGRSHRQAFGALVTATLVVVAAIATGVLPAVELPW